MVGVGVHAWLTGVCCTPSEVTIPTSAGMMTELSRYDLLTFGGGWARERVQWKFNELIRDGDRDPPPPSGPNPANFRTKVAASESWKLDARQ